MFAKASIKAVEKKSVFIYRMTKQTVDWNHRSKETHSFAHMEYHLAFSDHDYVVGSKTN